MRVPLIRYAKIKFCRASKLKFYPPAWNFKISPAPQNFKIPAKKQAMPDAD